ncbi:MAG: GNAT family N-acetyltransferase [Candidatus Lokiarchaeota archaeon]|nr:GNAT family N-acetyltransferase [Candidatus Lokiarchaeota archaeon]
MKIIKGYSQKINEQFTLRVANDNDEEIEKIVKLNWNVHGDLLKDVVPHIFQDHPRKKDTLCFYVEERYTGQAVSSLLLEPLEWRFDNVIVPSCEMDFVATLPQYRGRNFIGLMNELYEQVMKERGYLISVLRGIPYYYRRFGYEFVFNLDERVTLMNNLIPEIKYEDLRIRKANEEDLSFIKEKYDEFFHNFYVSNKFEPNSFKYKFMNEAISKKYYSAYILEERNVKLSVFFIGMSYDGSGFSLIVPPVSELNMNKIILYIKNKFIDKQAKDSDETKFCCSTDTKFGQYLIELGGVADPSYGWQVKIPNLTLFFKHIKSILEQRIEASQFKGISRDIKISDYHEILTLKFSNGKVIDVTSEVKFSEPEVSDVKIPGPVLYKLILSYNSFEEIKFLIKDAIIKPESKLLINILFPKKKSYPESYY